MSFLPNPVLVKNKFKSKLPSRVKTSHAAETDINFIVGRFMQTGVHPEHFPTLQYGDLTQAPPDLATAHKLLRSAEQQFLALPSGLRRELANDFKKFPAWLRDPDNFDRAVKLGLIEPPRTQQPAAGAPSGAAPGGGSPAAPTGAPSPAPGGPGVPPQAAGGQGGSGAAGA